MEEGVEEGVEEEVEERWKRVEEGVVHLGESTATAPIRRRGCRVLRAKLQMRQFLQRRSRRRCRRQRQSWRGTHTVPIPCIPCDNAHGAASSRGGGRGMVGLAVAVTVHAVALAVGLARTLVVAL